MPSLFDEIHGVVDILIFLKYKAEEDFHEGKMAADREKFVKLAEGRTRTALDAIRKIGNLSNKRAYDFEDQDVKKIIRALREATNDLERKFSSTTGGDTESFKL